MCSPGDASSHIQPCPQGGIYPGIGYPKKPAPHPRGWKDIPDSVGDISRDKNIPECPGKFNQSRSRRCPRSPLLTLAGQDLRCSRDLITSVIAPLFLGARGCFFLPGSAQIPPEGGRRDGCSCLRTSWSSAPAPERLQGPRIGKPLRYQILGLPTLQEDVVPFLPAEDGSVLPEFSGCRFPNPPGASRSFLKDPAGNSPLFFRNPPRTAGLQPL